jgi:hypothetical protein
MPMVCILFMAISIVSVDAMTLETDPKWLGSLVVGARGYRYYSILKSIISNRDRLFTSNY